MSLLREDFTESCWRLVSCMLFFYSLPRIESPTEIICLYRMVDYLLVGVLNYLAAWAEQLSTSMSFIAHHFNQID